MIFLCMISRSKTWRKIEENSRMLSFCFFGNPSEVRFDAVAKMHYLRPTLKWVRVSLFHSKAMGVDPPLRAWAVARFIFKKRAERLPTTTVKLKEGKHWNIPHCLVTTVKQTAKLSKVLVIKQIKTQLVRFRESYSCQATEQTLFYITSHEKLIGLFVVIFLCACKVNLVSKQRV